MQVLIEGHAYMVENFDKINEVGQQVRFIRKVPIVPGGTELETIEDGTTNEEVLAVLIDRMEYLQKKFPCRENAIAITNLEQALMWLNKRTENRKKRGVEGRYLS